MRNKLEISEQRDCDGDVTVEVQGSMHVSVNKYDALSLINRLVKVFDLHISVTAEVSGDEV